MQPTRRQLLLGVTASALAACTTDKPTKSAAPTLDDILRSEAVARERGLVDAYQAALLDRPELTPALAPLLAEHAAHLAALQPVPSPTPTPDASTGSPSPTPRARPRQTVLRELALQEKRAAAAHANAAERAESATGCDRVLAPLLASLAASEASHAVVL
ncbi:MAG: hypothetical protein M3P04_10175 [Actinomycetota bacterium]|nr:hypothetical protein [Actinomycetota bacterium]